MQRNKIRELRTRYFFSLQDLSDRSFVAKSTLYGIETGKNTANIYDGIRIAKALFTTVEELFFEDEEDYK